MQDPTSIDHFEEWELSTTERIFGGAEVCVLNITLLPDPDPGPVDGMHHGGPDKDIIPDNEGAKDHW